MTIKRSAHDILGVAPDAAEAEIKEAYKKGARKWHPDKNGGSEEANEKMAELNAAFEKLMVQGDTPAPQPRRYRSPPPQARRETSPPMPKWHLREEPRFTRYSMAASTYTCDSRDNLTFARFNDADPIFEERRPKGPLEETAGADPERGRSRPRSYRPEPPSKEKEYSARGRSGAEEDRYGRRQSSPQPRSSSAIYYEEREPRETFRPEQASYHATTRTKYACNPSAASCYEQPRNAPSPYVKLLEESATLPQYESVLGLCNEARRLVDRIEKEMSELIHWLLRTVKLDQTNPARMELAYDARDDALQGRENWSRPVRSEEIFAIHDDLLKMRTVLGDVEEELSVLVTDFLHINGRHFDREYDWGSRRRQELWDGLESFRSEVRRLPKSKHDRRRTTTTTIYRVR